MCATVTPTQRTHVTNLKRHQANATNAEQPRDYVANQYVAMRDRDVLYKRVGVTRREQCTYAKQEWPRRCLLFNADDGGGP